MNEFQRTVNSVKEAIKKIEEKGISTDTKQNLSDFKATKDKYIIDMYKGNISRLQSLINSPDLPGRANELIRLLNISNIEENKKVINELEKLEDIKIAPQKVDLNIGKLPVEIKDEVKADLEEMNKCFRNGCNRSAVILCGRIIEVLLHAKYYKVTGFDILDKNPGIGLGKLIAKMDEKGIKLDPGLTQQIHLVNNVRIFSVHKKQRAFYPTKQQTEAIMLYTFDVLDKIF